MAKLASIEELRNSLGREADATTHSMMNAALEGLTPVFESFIQTPFSRSVDQVTLFKLPAIDPVQGIPSLRLPVGFIEQVTVSTAYNVEDLDQATNPLDTSGYTLDLAQGYIQLYPGAYIQDNMVAVYYHAGFDTRTDLVGKVFRDVPDTIKQAAILGGQQAFNNLRMLNDVDQGGPELKLPPQLGQMLHKYRRLRQHVVYPYG